MTQRADVAVVGAGILGLAFAWEAARRGRSVVLFERGERATGASVRNFGMVWPIGQTVGEGYARALRSRERWLELGRRGVTWVSECGSLHLAHADDEDAVLREFAAAAGSAGVDCTYLSAEEAARRFPAINPANLKGALHSSVELAVNPPQAIARIPQYLAEEHAVTFRPGTAVVGVEMPRVVTAAGETWLADRVFVCSGTDFETLFPAVFAAAGVRRCKLQMMKTRPQPTDWRLGPHVAGGLTLCHYSSFALCRTLPALRQRFAETMPEYVRHGIHVMASQNDAGEGRHRRLARVRRRDHPVRQAGDRRADPSLPAEDPPAPGLDDRRPLARRVCEAPGQAHRVCGAAARMRGGDGPGRGRDDALVRVRPRLVGGARRMTPTVLLDRLDRLFADRGGAEYHGEAVSQLEHAMQSAALAEAAGSPSAWVAAALLHDVGHMIHGHGEGCAERGIDDRHEELGVRFLAKAFGPEVTEPIRLHVAAKRYLCAAEPDYFGRLSAASVRSLELQGGPMSAGEVEQFEANPHHAAAVAVRRWDDAAKVPGLPTPPFAHFRKDLEAALRGRA